MPEIGKRIPGGVLKPKVKVGINPPAKVPPGKVKKGLTGHDAFFGVSKAGFKMPGTFASKPKLAGFAGGLKNKAAGAATGVRNASAVGGAKIAAGAAAGGQKMGGRAGQAVFSTAMSQGAKRPGTIGGATAGAAAGGGALAAMQQRKKQQQVKRPGQV